MTTGLPSTSKEVEDRIKLDVAREAPDSNPYVQNSWLLALVTGMGRRIFDFYRDLKRSEENTFPDTATGDRAEQWGKIYGKTRTAATQATGNVVATGTAATLIPLGSALTAGEYNYTVTANSTIAAQVLAGVTITRSGSIATATTLSNHNLASNVPVTIASAVQTQYNVTNAKITVTGLTTFTYVVAGTPATPATGTITASFTSAVVPVQSVEFSVLANQTLDTPLTLQSPIAGAADVMNTSYAAISGGTDIESDAQFKARYLDRIQNPVAHFNETDIVSKAKEVPGVTRVFVERAGTVISLINISSITRNGQVATATTATPHGLEDQMQATVTGATQTEYNVADTRVLVVSTTVFVYIVAGAPATPATGGPSATISVPLGVCRVYFARDNDASSIPDAGEVATVYAKLSAIRPANTSANSLIVAAPTAVPVAFTFSSLTPNTLTMQAAIKANLAQYFEEETTVGGDITVDAYRSVINNTVDMQTGATVTAFALTTPTVAVVINAGQLATLGVVTI